MFAVSDAQLKTLDTSHRNRFSVRAIAYARQELPELATTDDDALSGILDKVIAQAATFDVVTEKGIMVLFVACLSMGPAILNQPRYTDLLVDDELPEDQRVMRFIRMLEDA